MTKRRVWDDGVLTTRRPDTDSQRWTSEGVRKDVIRLVTYTMFPPLPCRPDFGPVVVLVLLFRFPCSSGFLMNRGMKGVGRGKRESGFNVFFSKLHYLYGPKRGTEGPYKSLLATLGTYNTTDDPKRVPDVGITPLPIPRCSDKGVSCTP